MGDYFMASAFLYKWCLPVMEEVDIARKIGDDD